MKRGHAKGLVILAERLEIDVAFLQECVQHGAVRAEELPEDAAVPPLSSARLRRLQRLCRGLEVDVYAGAIIVELLERLDALNHDLDRLRRET
jgi:hypothetical protein